MYIHLQDFISGGKNTSQNPTGQQRQSRFVDPPTKVEGSILIPKDSTSLETLCPASCAQWGKARPRGGRAVELKGGRWHGSQKQRKRNDRKVTENVRVAAHQSSPHQIWRVFSSTWTPWNLAWRVASIFLWKKGNKNQVAKTRLGTSTNG